MECGRIAPPPPTFFRAKNVSVYRCNPTRKLKSAIALVELRNGSFWIFLDLSGRPAPHHCPLIPPSREWVLGGGEMKVDLQPRVCTISLNTPKRDTRADVAAA
jgi:hypothetical protein